MGSKLNWLIQKEAIPKGNYPHWIQKQTHYEALTGSIAYGCNLDTSDLDIKGICVPPKKLMFPHLNGDIIGFDDIKKFDQWQLHHIDFQKKTYDFTIHGIIDFFRKSMECNVGFLELMYVPPDCILHMTPLGAHIKNNRKLFLCKRAFTKFLGYCNSQIAKLDREPEGKRKESYDIWGFDLKYSYQAVRLASQLEQLLEFGTMDLRRDSEIYKAIRRGDWSLKQVKQWLNDKMILLNKLNTTTKVRNKAAKGEIKNLLLECLEMEFGSLSKFEMTIPDRDRLFLKEIDEVLDRWKQ